jgi:capsular polysaccharide biosynthesis protein
MANDLNQSLHDEEEINLIEIFKILLEYKKLIISTTLIFTIASIIYSFSLKPSFGTSAKLEIGYFFISNGDTELIESTSDLISNLNTLLLKNPDNKFNQNVSFYAFDQNIISLETISSSAEQNENLLTEMISYIDERHYNLALLNSERIEGQLIIEIEKIISEISHFKSKLSNQTQSMYLNFINNLEKENQAIESLNLLNKNSEYNDRIFYLDQKLSTFNYDLELLKSKVESKTQIIQEIKTDTNKPKIVLTILLGLIVGLITGISLVFTANFIKNYRKSEA